MTHTVIPALCDALTFVREQRRTSPAKDKAYYQRVQQIEDKLTVALTGVVKLVESSAEAAKARVGY